MIRKSIGRRKTGNGIEDVLVCLGKPAGDVGIDLYPVSFFYHGSTEPGV